MNPTTHVLESRVAQLEGGHPLSAVAVASGTSAIFYAIMALAGLLWSPLALPLGLAAHAVWDLLHHNGAFGAPVPKWYIPFCVVFDLLAAAFCLVLYLE